MGGFYSQRDRAGIERWWLEVTGKGDKTRIVPATAELMAELMTYRKANGLSALPTSGEGCPLVMPFIGWPVLTCFPLIWAETAPSRTR